MEEIRDILGKQQLEFRQIPQPAKNGDNKNSLGQGAVGLALVAVASTVTLTKGCNSCRSKASIA